MIHSGCIYEIDDVRRDDSCHVAGDVDVSDTLCAHCSWNKLGSVL